MLVGALRAPSAWAAVLSRGPEPPDPHGTGCGLRFEVAGCGSRLRAAVRVGLVEVHRAHAQVTARDRPRPARRTGPSGVLAGTSKISFSQRPSGDAVEAQPIRDNTGDSPVLVRNR